MMDRQSYEGLRQLIGEWYTSSESKISVKNQPLFRQIDAKLTNGTATHEARVTYLKEVLLGAELTDSDRVALGERIKMYNVFVDYRNGKTPVKKYDQVKSGLAEVQNLIGTAREVLSVLENVAHSPENPEYWGAETRTQLNTQWDTPQFVVSEPREKIVHSTSERQTKPHRPRSLKTLERLTVAGVAAAAIGVAAIAGIANSGKATQYTPNTATNISQYNSPQPSPSQIQSDERLCRSDEMLTFAMEANKDLTEERDAEHSIAQSALNGLRSITADHRELAEKYGIILAQNDQLNEQLSDTDSLVEAPLTLTTTTQVIENVEFLADRPSTNPADNVREGLNTLFSSNALAGYQFEIVRAERGKENLGYTTVIDTLGTRMEFIDTPAQLVDLADPIARAFNPATPVDNSSWESLVEAAVPDTTQKEALLDLEARTNPGVLDTFASFIGMSAQAQAQGLPALPFIDADGHQVVMGSREGVFALRRNR